MEKITCPWDDHGKLLPGLTVRQYVQCLVDMGVSGNITIDRVYYNLHSLLIAPPDRVKAYLCHVSMPTPHMTGV